MALFENKKTGEIVDAYECIGTDENKEFLKSKLEEQSFSAEEAEEIIAGLGDNDHIIIMSLHEYKTMDNTEFKETFESHMITPEEEETSKTLSLDDCPI